MRSSAFIAALSVPSIAVDQQHKHFPFWFLIFWRASDEVLPRSQEETNQEEAMVTNTPYPNSRQITKNAQLF